MSVDCFKNYFFSNPQIGINYNAVKVGRTVKVGGNDYFVNTNRPFVPLYACNGAGTPFAFADLQSAMPGLLPTIFDDYLSASNDYVNGVTGNPAEFVAGNNDAYASYIAKSIAGVPENLERFTNVPRFVSNYWQLTPLANIDNEKLNLWLQYMENVIDKRLYLPPGFILLKKGCQSAVYFDDLYTYSAGDPVYLAGLEIHSIG